MVYSESSLRASDGLMLFSCEWKPVASVKAAVCLVHGLGEYCGRYEHVASALTKAGYAVMAFDIRGHGRSGGPKGHTPSYDLLMQDISIVLAETSKRFIGLPCFLYGHSMGGNLVINYALRHKPKLSGIVSTSPWLMLSFEPKLIKVTMGRIMNIFFPAFTQSNGLDASAFFHDPDGVRIYTQDPLNHSFISARMFASIRKSGLWAVRNGADFPLPLLLMHGSADRITSHEASRRFAETLPEFCTFKLWDGCYHELHNEPQKQEVLDCIIDWMEKHRG